MAQQDPWRKAYNLTRTRTPAGVQPGTRSGQSTVLRRRSSPWLWLLLCLALLGAGGFWLWEQRGVLIPRYAPQLPATVARQVEQTPLPRQELDIALLDGGLGIGLAIGGDYLNLVDATASGSFDWKLVTIGPERLRMTAPGLKVMTSEGRITTWQLDVAEAFGNPVWEPYRKGLTEAGISPDLNWRVATGEASMPEGVTEQHLSGRGGFSFGGNPATSSYTLVFRDGWLKRIEAGLSTGEIAPLPPPDERARETVTPLRPEPLNPVLPDPPAG